MERIEGDRTHGPAVPGGGVGSVPPSERALDEPMCRWAADHDDAGTLGARFERPAEVSNDDIRLAETEEGWILGRPPCDASIARAATPSRARTSSRRRRSPPLRTIDVVIRAIILV